MQNFAHFKHFALAAVTVSTLLAFAPARAADEPTGIQDAIPVAASLSGSTKDDGWYNLSVSPQTKVVDGVSTDFPALSGYPGVFNSAQAWSSPVHAQVNSGGTAAAFNKVTNGNGTGGLDKFNADGTRNATAWNGTGFGPYPAGGSIYAISFSNAFNARGGSFGAFEANPVANLANVVFQVEIGSANGYDFYEPSVPTDPTSTNFGTIASRQIGALDVTDYFPVLNLAFTNGSTQTLSANFAELITQGENGTIPMPTGPNGELVDEAILINLYGFQWDLSSYSDIASFNVTFDVVEHSQTYAARLTQSDVFNQAIGVVPEPSTYAMLLVGLGIMSMTARRRLGRV